MSSKTHSSMELASVIATEMAKASPSVCADVLYEQSAGPGSEFVWRDAPVCQDCAIASTREWMCFTVGCTECGSRMAGYMTAAARKEAS